MSYSGEYSIIRADELDVANDAIIQGNVGVGTTSPSSTVYIHSTNNITTGSNFANQIAPLCIDDGGASSIMIDSNQIERKGGALNINHTSTENVLITTGGGNVGIGVTAPESKLQVFGAMDYNPSTKGIHMGHIWNNNTRCQINFCGGYDTMIDFSRPGQSMFDGRIYYLHSDNSMKFLTNSTDRVIIDSSGNMGLGTNYPQGWRIYINGSGRLNAAAWTYNSDDRIKYNEEVIAGVSALDTIMKLSPQLYQKIGKQPENALGEWIPTDQEWADGASNNFDWTVEAGFIAQDIKKIPELAYLVSGELYGMRTPNPDPSIDIPPIEPEPEVLTQTPLGLRYQDIFIYNVSATQKLSRKLDTEKAKVSLLEERLLALEDAVF